MLNTLFYIVLDIGLRLLGDAVEVMDFVNKKPTMIPLAWPANRQGRIVADNIYYYVNFL
ncbi:hypothetical protein GKZ28_06820 [Clostridium chromiireducens]|uniref:Uncharacterized protein n=1 Tax=Clostridium chromiireducens TaxID=225345 RepID=A0A964RKS7_9CLOT|nr:hypothetical protein [Clostridium chromiireducens]MVX63406.1 hypothetical protein [Clostridium chromiireducens]